MPILKNVLGLDIGSHTLKAVELAQTLRGVEAVQLRLHPRVDPDAALPDQLLRFVKLHELSHEHVVTALSGLQASSRRLHFPFRDRRRLDAAVPFEVEGQVPFDLDDIVVDWQMADHDRTQCHVNAIIARKPPLEALLDDLASADLSPRTLEVEGPVLANLATVFDLQGRRLLVDFGHTKATLCLLVDGVPVDSRTVGIGSGQITEALAKELDLAPDDAEHRKCEDGIFHTGFNSASPGALAVLDRLGREIVRTVEADQSLIGGAPDQELDEVTLLGGGAKLHRLDEYLAETTSLPVRRLGLPADPAHAALVAGGDPLLFAPALALALRGTSRARTSLNLRQDEFAYRTSLRDLVGPEMRTTAILAGIAVLFFGASTVTALQTQRGRAEQLLERARDVYSQVLPDRPRPENPMAALSQELQAAQARADFLGVYGGNRSAVDLLAALSRQIPPDLDIRFDEISIDRRSIKIKVESNDFESADRLSTLLSQNASFPRIDVGEVTSKRRTNTKSFPVTILLDVPESS